MASGHYQKLLLKKLHDTCAVHLDQMEAGTCTDYAAYREQVGYLRGLRDAIILLEETEKDME
jgi:hypothetical protein